MLANIQSHVTILKNENSSMPGKNEAKRKLLTVNEIRDGIHKLSDISRDDIILFLFISFLPLGTSLKKKKGPVITTYLFTKTAIFTKIRIIDRQKQERKENRDEGKEILTLPGKF